MIDMQHGANSDTDPAMTAATTDPPKKMLLPPTAQPTSSPHWSRLKSSGRQPTSQPARARHGSSAPLWLAFVGRRAVLVLSDRHAQPLMLLAQSL